jgi:hypothetical protein
VAGNRSFALRVLTAATACAVLIPGAGQANDAESSLPIEILGPANAVSIAANESVTFRVRSHPGDTLSLSVSKSPNVIDQCGRIGDEMTGVLFTQTSADPSVYEVAPPISDLSETWSTTPGTYYWQAYRLEPSGAGNGCTATEVRSLTVTAPLASNPPPKPKPRPKPRPKPKPQSKPTQPHPLGSADARLVGRYIVRQKIIKSVRFHERAGVTSDDIWAFVPRCARGPCRVGLVFTVRDTIRIELARSGAAYVGHGSGRLATCNGRAVTGSIDIRLSVTTAATISSVWRATRWTGKLDLAVPETVVGKVICRAGSYTKALAGSLPSV